jgi:hypothetical protein
VLERRLAATGFEVDVVCISLSRNDSTARGLTRLDLLSRALDGFNFRDKDLLLYTDEWCTGANFKNLCKLMVKFVRRLPVRVDFVPVALISPAAHEDPRFPLFLKKHEVLVQQAGLDRTDGLFIFPHMSSRFITDGRLFWAERDRMAGYRKIPLYQRNLGGDKAMATN